MVGAAGFEPAANGSTVHSSARFPRVRRNNTLLSYAPSSDEVFINSLKGLLLGGVLS
jgi:hypothetical protein